MVSKRPLLLQIFMFLIFLHQSLQIVRRLAFFCMLLFLAFALQKLVYEAGGVLTALGYTRGEFGSFGRNERGFAAVDLFGFEDHLLC